MIRQNRGVGCEKIIHYLRGNSCKIEFFVYNSIRTIVRTCARTVKTERSTNNELYS